jgi:hypothetical protein
VIPFSQIAETVREAGVESTYEKFQAKVMGWDCAILKKAMVVCGGWVMVRRPAGTELGMLRAELVAALVPALVAALEVALEICWDAEEEATDVTGAAIRGTKVCMTFENKH